MPGQFGQGVQAVIRQFPQRIGIRRQAAVGHFSDSRVDAEIRRKHGRGGGDGRHGLPALRTPSCAAVHTHSISGGSDIL
ncbi:hypothetical protein [Arthrobacter sp. B10-11]|uniref:hypothetical protein n=1 Tax=Arthrobacter sp. B10-11 TaxID=3081160 RepID=UPI002954BEFF|nr:hypothetical protein [Arthrobacter sp. B10-11]MDV8146139.1 hypothetical protein [Arthrobacter sp. B10-11]